MGEEGAQVLNDAWSKMNAGWLGRVSSCLKAKFRWYSRLSLSGALMMLWTYDCTNNDDYGGMEMSMYQ